LGFQDWESYSITIVKYMDYFFNFDKMAYVSGEKYPGCILCAVAEERDNLPRLVIWENDTFCVSVNLYPYNPGHLLIFPREHIVDIRELSEKAELELSSITRSCLDLLDMSHSPSAYNIGYNMGLTAGASIDHLHRHIIPRYPRETGIADLLAGKRVLVESPFETCRRLRETIESSEVPLF
jgi:ATP adenylyltransferase